MPGANAKNGMTCSQVRRQAAPDRRVTLALFDLKLVEPKSAMSALVQPELSEARGDRVERRCAAMVWSPPTRYGDSALRRCRHGRRRLVSLGVWFPPAKLNTLSTTPELVEHHWGRARVHRIVPKKAAHGIERAIDVVDTIINPDLVAILDPIFGHGLICPRSIE